MESIQPSTAAPTGQPRPFTTRCLVVDDDQTVQMLLATFLGGSGFEIRCASSGRAAIETASSFFPHLIFMDLDMPGLSGLETTREIRSLNTGFCDPPVIIAFTSLDTPAIRDECLAAGMDDFIQKPFNPLLIEAVLERWVRA